MCVISPGFESLFWEAQKAILPGRYQDVDEPSLWKGLTGHPDWQGSGLPGGRPSREEVALSLASGCGIIK